MDKGEHHFVTDRAIKGAVLPNGLYPNLDYYISEDIKFIIVGSWSTDVAKSEITLLLFENKELAKC